MTKNEVIKWCEGIKGLPREYGGKEWTLKEYRIDDEMERVYLTTSKNKQYDRTFEGMPEFTKQITTIGSYLERVKTAIMKDEKKEELAISGAPKTFSDLRAMLMENIEKLRAGKMEVDVAKEICSHAQTVVNITKLELEYFKNVKNEK